MNYYLIKWVIEKLSGRIDLDRLSRLISQTFTSGYPLRFICGGLVALFLESRRLSLPPSEGNDRKVQEPLSRERTDDLCCASSSDE